MPRILIAGAPTGCWTNLGDEAIFTGMLEALRAAFADVQVVVVSSCPEGFFGRYDCDAVSFRDVSGLVDAVADSDMLLLGGGSIFFDYWQCDPATVLTERHSGLALWTGLTLLAAAAGKPVMLYGAGVGPLRTAAGQMLAKSVFEIAAALCVRDPDALSLLETLGFGPGQTMLTGDPVIGLPLPPSPAIQAPRPWLGVALRQWEDGVDPEHWQAETAAALDAFLVGHAGTVVFVACHRGVAWPLTDDSAAAQAVQSRMRLGERSITVGVDLPWPQRAALLADCDQVLAMRYHASLIAMSAGTPAVGMSYDPKVSGLFSDWGMADLAVPMDQVSTDALLTRLRRAREERDRIADQLRQRVKPLDQREHGNIDTASRLSKSFAPTAGGDATGELLERLADGNDERLPAAAQALRLLRARYPETTAARGVA